MIRVGLRVPGEEECNGVRVGPISRGDRNRRGGGSAAGTS